MCKVIAITNRKLCREDFFARIRLLCEVGVDAVVLREKDLQKQEYEALAKKTLEICRGTKTRCVLHYFFETAQALGASGIHLSVPQLSACRDEWLSFPVRGASIHSLEQLRIAQQCQATGVFFGHVFATDCKRGVEPRGLDSLQKICQQSTIPIYAIGGIAPDNVQSVCQAGAAGVCVMSYAMRAEKEELRCLVKQCHTLSV